MRIRTFACVSLLLLTAATGCQSAGRTSPLTVLGASIDPLRERFNAEKDRVRVVAILSPT